MVFESIYAGSRRWKKPAANGFNECEKYRLLPWAMMLSCCLASPLLAQNGPIRFERLTIQDGLSQATVNHILQDSKGFLWVATQDGLNRYDGYEFKIYRKKPDDPGSLSGNYIGPLYEDRNGTLWVGMALGLHAYDRDTDSFHHYLPDPEYPESAWRNNVSAIHEDRDGNLWVGTGKQGLLRFARDTEAFEVFHKENIHGSQGKDAHIRVIQEDRFGQLWFGTEDGRIFRLDRDRKSSISFNLGPMPKHDVGLLPIMAIHPGSDGYLWVGTLGAGVRRINPDTPGVPDAQNVIVYQNIAGDPTSLGDDSVLSIAEDAFGDLWIGFADNGLSKLDRTTNTFTHFRHDSENPHSISGNYVKALTSDRWGNFWAGTAGGGLNKFNPAGEVFRNFHHRPGDKDSLSSNAVRAILEDHRGTLWVGTRHGGLNRLDRHQDGQFGEAFQHYPILEGQSEALGSDRVRSLFEDRAGNLWIGSGDRGLFKLDKARNEFTHFLSDINQPDALRSVHILCIYEDRNDTLWVGTLQGLGRLNKTTNRFHNYFHRSEDPQSLSINGVNAVLETRDGQFWVGTNGAGLDRLNRRTGQFEHFPHQSNDPHSLSDNLVMSLFEDENGYLWIGTMGGGLNRRDPITGHFQAFREGDGLPNNTVYGIQSDNQGFLWLSTHKGLARFDRVTETFKCFDVHDGLQSNEFDFGAYAKGGDGTLYFGGINGFTSFMPREIQVDPIPPEIVMTDFQVNNKPVAIRGRPKAMSDGASQGKSSMVLDKAIDETQSLRLTYKDRVISFCFSGIHLVNPAKNAFAYRLRGFSDEWVYVHANKRVATYTNLDPGPYVFEVKARNHDGVWNESPKAVRLVVQPPPWLSPWAYTLYALLGLSLVFSLFRGHRKLLAYERSVVQRLKKVDRLKDLFLANTSHELRTPLNGIIGLAETLRNGATGQLPEQTKHHLTMIETSGKRLAHLVDDMQDHSKLETDNLTLVKKAVDLHALTDVVFTLCQPLLGDKELLLVNDIPIDIPAVAADEDRLQQIVFNLVGNGIKFSQTGQVTLSAHLDLDQITVAVTDSGIGIPEDHFERIFESFAQGDFGINHSFGGMGLGLAIARRLVNLHAGTLSVSSTVGQGSVFKFTLPIFQGTPSVSQPSPPAINVTQMAEVEPVRTEMKPQTKSPHILVVDDDPINRQVLINHLELEGYRVTAVAGGPQALGVLAGDRVQMVLLDIMMPQMSGYEVCREMRKRYPLLKIPVLFLTAKDRMMDLVDGFASGANDFLTKPIAREELLARVQTHLKLADLHRAVEEQVTERTRELAEKHQEALAVQSQLAQQTEILKNQARLLRESDLLKSGFFTGISHEFRTPLTLIIDPLESMLEGEVADSETLKRQLQMMLRNSRKLLKLINQLLDISQLDAGKMPLRPEYRDVVAFADGLILAFSAWAERKNIALDFESDVPTLFVWFDPDKLEKALDNLLANAMKYTDAGGKIRVLLSNHAEQGLSLRVRDTGKGIPCDLQDHVFDRFFFSREVDPALPASSGVGLSLAREMIRLHGGDIRVVSEEGFGSEFIIELPLQPFELPPKPCLNKPPTVRRAHQVPVEEELTEIQVVEPKTAQPSPVPGERETVLIVEDHAEVRRYLSQQLAPVYETYSAESGLEGLRLAREKKPNLILSDVMMPGMNGLELCHALKKDQHCRHIPVLLLTAKAGLTNKLQGLDMGADDYLVKPFSSKELRARIKNLIHSRKQLRLIYSETFILEPEQINMPSQDHAFLQRAMTVLEQRFGQSYFDVNELADELALSSRQLQRKLVRLTGEGPGALIRKFRLKRAAQLLERHAGSVAEISHLVGFKNPFYFSTLFRQTFGKPPQEFSKDVNTKQHETSLNRDI